jgi:hypothetical protein
MALRLLYSQCIVRTTAFDFGQNGPKIEMDFLQSFSLGEIAMTRLFLAFGLLALTAGAATAYAQTRLPNPFFPPASESPHKCLHEGIPIPCEAPMTSATPMPQRYVAPKAAPGEKCIAYLGSECITANTPPNTRATSRPSTWNFHYMPPPEYDHPFQGTTEIIYATDQAALKAACRLEKLNPEHIVLGCRHVVGTPPQACVILLPPQKDIEATGIPVAQIIRHEEAHCSGWPADHPGGMKTYATGR